MQLELTLVAALVAAVLAIMLLRAVVKVTMNLLKIGAIVGLFLLGGTMLNLPVDALAGGNIAGMADGVTGMIAGGVQVPDATNATDIINATNTTAAAEQAKETVLDALLDLLLGG